MKPKKLNISDRCLRKLLFNYKEAGVAKLISKKRGKKSNRAYNKEFKLKVINLVKEKYRDFGPTFAAEKLEEYDGIILILTASAYKKNKSPHTIIIINVFQCPFFRFRM